MLLLSVLAPFVLQGKPERFKLDIVMNIIYFRAVLLIALLCYKNTHHRRTQLNSTNISVANVKVN